MERIDGKKIVKGSWNPPSVSRSHALLCPSDKKSSEKIGLTLLETMIQSEIFLFASVSFLTFFSFASARFDQF